MHRLVVALTSLITLAGAAVVGGYLLLFEASTDRAAAVVPADTPLYLNIYLQPSAGQQMNLEALVSRLPGFADTASFDEKVDQVMQNLFSAAEVDYLTDVKPWLGNQVAVAAAPAGADPAEADALLVADVKDRPAAEAAMAEHAAGGAEPTTETYEGVEIVTVEAGAYAFVNELLVFGSGADHLRGAVDAARGAQPSLADHAPFREAMAALPPDHLASGYVDFEALATASDVPAQPSGFSVGSFVLVAEQDALRIAGQAPFDAEAADAAMRDALAAMSAEPTVADWMPAGTQLSVVMFGVQAGLAAAEQAAEDAAEESPDAESLAETLDGIRGLAALGFGIDVDADLLSLLDGEVGLALGGITTDGSLPRAQLIVRPTDPDAAQASLDRVRQQVEQRGVETSEIEAAGTTIVTLMLPDLGEVSYAFLDGAVILGLTPDDVALAVEARQNGDTLGATDVYRNTFAQSERHAGNELYVDVGSLVDSVAAGEEMPADVRDVVGELGTLGLNTWSEADLIEFHAVLTVR
jgi:hypothetical protein